MPRTLAVVFLLTLGLVVYSISPVLSAQAAAPAVPATPENAAAFLGDWTVVATGANGSSTSALSIKAEGGKVTAEITAEMLGHIVITDIQKSGASLFLSYGFDYQGMAVPVVASLTPDGDKMAAQFDYAGGAYVASGTATKKK